MFVLAGGLPDPIFKVLLMMAWGGVGWGGCNNVHVCCLACDATLVLRSCLGGVGWGRGCNICSCMLLNL